MRQMMFFFCNLEIQNLNNIIPMMKTKTNKIIVTSTLLSLVFLWSGAQAEQDCRKYTDLSVGSSIGSWQEKFDNIPPRTNFVTTDDNHVGNLIDQKKEGMMDDYWFNSASLTTPENPAQIIAQLSQARSISQIVLNNFNSKDISSEYEIYFSASPTHYNDISEIDNSIWTRLPDSSLWRGNVKPDEEKIITLPESLMAKHLKIELTPIGKSMSLNEIELYGSDSGLLVKCAEKTEARKVEFEKTTEKKNFEKIKEKRELQQKKSEGLGGNNLPLIGGGVVLILLGIGVLWKTRS